MATEREDFDAAGAANGSNISISYDLIDGGALTASSTCTFDSGWFITGGFSCKFGITNGGTGYRQLNLSSGLVAQVTMEALFKMDAFDTTTTFTIILAAYSTSTIRAQVCLNTSKQFRLRNGTTAIGSASTTVVAANQVYRLRWKLDNTGAVQSLEIYTGNNLWGSTPDETIGGAASSYNQGTINNVRWGCTATTAAAFNIWFDAIAYNEATTYPTAPFTQVTGTLTLKQATRQAISGTRTLVQATRSAVSGTLTLVQPTRVAVSGTRTLVHATRVAVSGTRTIKQATRAPVSGTLTIKQATRSAVSGTLTIKQATRVSVAGTLTLKQATRSAVSGTYTIKQATRSAVSGTYTLKQATRQAVSGTRTLRHATRVAVSGTLTIKQATLAEAAFVGWGLHL